MSRILFYDTETTGLPLWKLPSDDPGQPHLVEVGAIVVDADYEIVHSLSLIVRPDDWVIPADVTEVHGISHERAMDVGIPEALAVDALRTLAAGCELRVGFNEMFDARILRIGLKRYHGQDAADAFKAQQAKCAMRMTQKLLGGQLKTLEDAYFQIVGKEFDGAHSALADTQATASLYKHLQELLACSSAT